jgi:uncharacterized membrane protein (UPF0127 family)
MRCLQVSIATPRGPATVTAEVVATRPEIERGLMFRDYLAPDAGMLFLMGHEAPWAFYMRNTRIPLDMIYIGRDQTVVGVIENAVPFAEEQRGVGRLSLYVLEVNGGWAAAHRVGIGSRVRFYEGSFASR